MPWRSLHVIANAVTPELFRYTRGTGMTCLALPWQMEISWLLISMLCWHSAGDCARASSTLADNYVYCSGNYIRAKTSGPRTCKNSLVALRRARYSAAGRSLEVGEFRPSSEGPASVRCPERLLLGGLFTTFIMLKLMGTFRYLEVVRF